MNIKNLIAILAIIANIFLAAGKLIVGAISSSAAILADGINSGTDIVASLISYIGIKTAQKPADKEHPYGHEKAEFISGLIITIIIFLSSLYIIYDAIMGLITGSELSLGMLAFIVMGGSALINGVMSQLKIYYGKKYDSASLISDGVHSRIDLLVSLGIFIGLFLTRIYAPLDSILALLVGLYILKESFELGKETTDSLLGESAGESVENKIKDIVKKNKLELKQLKTQKLGAKIFAELKIKLPSKLKIEEADSLMKKLENNLLQNVNKLEYISIQIESHDISTGFHKSAFGIGKGLGWGRGLRRMDKQGDSKTKGQDSGEKQGAGPEGYCVCPKENCNYKIKHKPGIPCKELKCPEHNIGLVREK